MLAWVVGLLEFVCGLCLALGLATRLAAGPIIVFLIMTIVTYHWEFGFKWETAASSIPCSGPSLCSIFWCTAAGRSRSMPGSDARSDRSSQAGGSHVKSPDIAVEQRHVGGGRSLRAGAQDYPARPIRIIVPLAAGGMADILARVIAAKLSEARSTAVVENRTGGSGVIGADAVAKSPADGYTLLMGLHATQAILVHMTRLPYDPAKDFAPVIHVATVPNVLLVHNSVPASSVSELIAHAKANPGKLTFASQGNGSTGHMIGEQFKAMAGIDLTHVPYRGAAPASQDLLAGHVSMLFDIVPLAVSNLQSGKVRALAVCARSA